MDVFSSIKVMNRLFKKMKKLLRWLVGLKLIQLEQ